MIRIKEAASNVFRDICVEFLFVFYPDHPNILLFLLSASLRLCVDHSASYRHEYFFLFFSSSNPS
jgi:hypothetical protein